MHSQVENSFIHIYKNTVKLEIGKISKAMKKINCQLKQHEFDEISIYTGNLCAQQKVMIRTKQTYSLSPSTPVTVFLIL